MNKEGNKNLLGKMHHFFLIFDIGLFTFILLFPMIVIEKFVKPEKRGLLWCKAAVWIIRTAFDLNGISIKTRNHLEHEVGKSFVYAANHPSDFDGFILLTILGPKSILFIAPLQQFPKILATWMNKMEAVTVRRDVIDDIRYPKGESKQHAIQHAIKAIKNGNSLIIFPEGHIELTHLLHYFHTGAARISVGAHTPIIPVALRNADKVFPDEKSLTPGTVTVTFGAEIPAPENQIKKSHTEFPWAKVLATRNKIEKAIVDMLPMRYQPDYFKQPKTKKIGVFIDIDRTIYGGFSQKDLVKYLFALHKLHYGDALKVFYWLFLEKAGKMPHKELMRKSLFILNGWDVGELRNVVHHSFYKKIVKNIQYGLFPILKDHAEAKHSIVFVSEVIHPLAQEFKHLFAGRTTLDTKLAQEHHCYTGKVKCLCYKDVKARLLQEFASRANIDLSKSYAYGDSFADIPFMSLVGHATAINPDPDLLRYAKKKHFAILEDAR
ncbi:MAG: HAD-subfamily IB hydrolase [Parcubacteria group bacterium GW2011_GWC2_39_14]|nr:MAG: HAD-subfamily IB hydrolase [Parcubacteria group bacterium GW2011_GWC2_39_14]KKR55554.1 MAG: HAD-subfamily IB hydrolase [Parcubacteria group bacterium GW2011_GWA2_40_23]